MIKVNLTWAARSYASSRTSHVPNVPNSDTGEDPRPACQGPRQRSNLDLPDQGCSGPKTAALPADAAKHMANHRHAAGHAFLRCNIPLHGGRW